MIYNKGFAAANDGNISIRVGENEFLCTPTMHSKGFLKPDDICTIDITNIPNMVVKIAAKIPAISMLRNKDLPFGVTVGTFTNGKIKIICEPTKTNTEIPTPSHET